MPRKRKHTFETEKEAFPTNLRALLDEMDIAQEALANVIGMTRQAISKYTTGQSTPDINTLAKMADFFGVSCDYLLGRTGDVKTPDIETRAIHDKTGLSENAIKELKILNDISIRVSDERGGAYISEIDFVNVLLEDSDNLSLIVELTNELLLADEENLSVPDKARMRGGRLYICQESLKSIIHVILRKHGKGWR